MKLATGIHYDVPMEAYLGNPVEGHSVSASNLTALETACPRIAWWESYLNPERVIEDTAATAFGTMFHTLLLENIVAFDRRYRIQPDDLNLNSKDGRAFKDECEKGGFEIVKQEAFDRACAMVKAMVANPAIEGAFASGRQEVTLIWKDEETGLYCKSRPDWFCADRALAVDIKTAASVKPDKWLMDAVKFGYHRQTAFCLMGLEALGIVDPVYMHAAIEKDAPFLTQPFLLPDDLIAWGRKQCRANLRRWADCLARDHWPGYVDGIATPALPDWMNRQMEAADIARDEQEQKVAA